MGKYIPKEFSPNIYSAWFRIFETLSSEERSELLLAISGYPDYEPKTQIALWPFFKCELDRQFEKFMARNKQQKENRNRSTLSGERQPSSTEVDHGRPNENMVDQNANNNNNNNNNNNREHKTENKEQETQTKPSGFSTETQTEPNHNPNEEKPASRKSDDFRVSVFPKIVSKYNSILGDKLPRVSAQSDKRIEKCRKWANALYREKGCKSQDELLVEAEKFFRQVLRCPFLLGEAGGDRYWRADFDFLMTEKGRIGVIEGKYDGHAQVSVSKPNIFTVPSSQRRMQIAQAENYEPDFALDSFGVAK